ncbi:MAG: carotenoid biosynthesis protein [Candidatus Thermoplasmatota archaeon]|nr:carotenoid biosynthesis protein [Candidatus Thermoplasmatota archaeon]
MGKERKLSSNTWFDPKRTPRLVLVVAGLIAFMFIIARYVPTRGPEGGWEGHGDSLIILHVFELACLSFMFFSILHAWYRWGRQRTIFFFMFALIYGFILEDLTVTFSGYYEYNPHAWIQVHNTMMAVPFCWTAVIYVIQYIIEENPSLSSLKKIEKGLLAGVLAVSIDVGIDSVFVGYGLWRWLEGQWFEVPLANYTAWFMAVGGFIVFWSDLDRWKAPQFLKEISMTAGIVVAYGSLLIMVLLTYLLSEVWFHWW